MQLSRTLAPSLVAVWLALCATDSESRNAAGNDDQPRAVTRIANKKIDQKAALSQLYASVEMPPGFRQVLAQDQGLIFIDDRGMALYLWGKKRGPLCKNELDPITAGVDPLMQLAQPHIRTCIAQRPPVLAKPDAKPVGDWAFVERPDGARQWTYKGYPVHYSIADRLPGDVNGISAISDFAAAQPPMIVPAGIKVKYRRGAGLIATDTNGLILYTAVVQEQRSQKREAGTLMKTSLDITRVSGEEFSSKWNALSASVLADAIGPWSARAKSDGVKIWNYQNQPVYTFGGDHSELDVGGYGIDNARPLILLPASKAPLGVSVRRSVQGPVYTNANGGVLYTFFCSVLNPAGEDGLSGAAVSCDNWDESYTWAESYCAAKDRCAERWKPFIAPADAKPKGGTWSQVIIPDPVRYPLRWVPLDHAAAKTPGAVKAWTYSGRPVYTYVADTRPGELRGDLIWVAKGSRWGALLAGLKE